MIRVRFDPASLPEDQKPWWDAWRKRADKERAACIEANRAGRQYEFVDAIWRDLKQFLLKHVFHGKCGYCESPVTVISFGDADHYRPKGKVTVRQGNRDQTVTCGGSPHPGYYWLAYEWTNLVPACEKCNRAGGKMSQFPVRLRHWCGSPGNIPTQDALDAFEKPLLLNPHHDHGSCALTFGHRGAVARLDGDDRGRHTIDVYQLDREELTTERARAQERGWLRYLSALGSDREEDVKRVLDDYTGGSEPYSLAVVHYIKMRWEEQRHAISAIQDA